MRSLVQYGLALLAAMACSPAGAMGLGAAQLNSGLGQSLDVKVAVNAANGEDVGCVQVRGREDLPPPVGLHAELVTDEHGTYIHVTSGHAVDDPAVALVLSAGCGSPVTREYVLLVNPAALAAPAALASAPATDLSPAPAVTNVAPTQAPRPLRSGANALAGSRRAAASSSHPVEDQTASAAAAGPVRPSKADSTARRGAPAALAPTNPAPVNRIAPSEPVDVALAPVPDAGRGDRLHLSRPADSPDLRMALDLGLSDEGGPPDAARLAELRALQARLMALLNGQEPESAVSPREQDLQKRAKELATDVAVLRQQVKEAQDRSQSLEQSHISEWLIWLLAACALLGLAIAAWFIWRYRTVQAENTLSPWWEQSQLAQAGRAAARPPSSIALGAPIAEEDNTTPGLAAASAMRPPAARPATAPPSRVRPAGLPSVAPPARSAPSPLGTAPRAPVPPAPRPAPSGAPPSAAPRPTPGTSPARPAAPAASTPPTNPTKSGTAAPFGIVSNPLASLNERVENTELTRSAIDFNLDLPEVTNPASGAPAPAPSAGGPPSATPAPIPKLQPLEFELPSPNAPRPVEPKSMGPDTILRLDEASSGTSGTPVGSGEQASLQFRLLQFAAAIEQASELHAGHEPTKAIAVLRQYVLRDESIPTLMWLMLFALYREVNKRPVYEALADHFSRRYKRSMAGWDEPLEQKTPQVGLSEVPEIGRQLKARWGTQAGLELLRGLICDRDQADAIVFNAVLQRDLLAQAKIFPIEDSV
ncbi:MAG: hypothetical protein ABSF50_08620 [Burkholderiaceae bacterium]